VTGASSNPICRTRFARAAENNAEAIDARGADSGQGVRVVEALGFTFGSTQPTASYPHIGSCSAQPDITPARSGEPEYPAAKFT
jgi:hypothetical protein